MATLNVNQIAKLAYDAGFRGSALTMAVGVALAESSGNPRAYNPEVAAGTKPGLGSYGLWQIYRQAHPEFSNVDLYDPQQNARAAYSVYRAAGNRFTPWSTYNNGTAAKYAKGLQGSTVNVSSQSVASGLQQNTPTPERGAAHQSSGPATTGTAVGVITPSAASPLVSVSLLPPALSDAISSPDFKTRMIVGAVGLILFVFGLMLLVGSLANQANLSYIKWNVKMARKVIPSSGEVQE